MAHGHQLTHARFLVAVHFELLQREGVMSIGRRGVCVWQGRRLGAPPLLEGGGQRLAAIVANLPAPAAGVHAGDAV